MGRFVRHCKARRDVATVEQCLLHMDVGGMDLDMILNLLKVNGMYSALIHVFKVGLDDYASPQKVLFEAFFDSIDGA